MSEAQLKNLAFSGGASAAQAIPQATQLTQAPAQTVPSRDYNRQILDALKSTWKL